MSIKQANAHNCKLILHERYGPCSVSDYLYIISKYVS